MKKSFVFMSAVAVAAAALVSCQKEQDVKIEEPKGIPFEIVADTEETKTTNADNKTNWVAGDQINLFHAVNGSEPYTYVSDGAFEAVTDGESVAFTGTLAEALDSEKNYDWYGIYPYATPGSNTPAAFAGVVIGSSADGSQTQTGPDSKAHLAGPGYPIAGRVTNKTASTKPVLAMKQLTSVIAVNVTNKTAGSISVTGVSVNFPDETDGVIGTYTVNFSEGTPTFTAGTISKTASLTVSGDPGMATDASSVYYLAIRPFTAKAGTKINITVNIEGGGSQTLSNIVPSDFKFVANKIHTLNFHYTGKVVSLAEFKYNDPTWLTAQGIALPNPSTNLDGATQTVGDIEVTSTDGSTKTRAYKSGDAYDLRVYTGGSLTIAASNDKYISKITLAGKNITNLGLAEANTWIGKQVAVKLSATGTANVNTINVFYQAAEASDHLLEIPTLEYSVAYTETSQAITFYKANVSDLEISSSSAGYISHVVSGNTITVNFSANSNTDPRDIVINVASASAGFDEDICITQAGAPSTISTLSNGVLGTVTAQVSALTTNGFVIADNTGSIFVYKSGQGVSIGQTVTVSGTVTSYNKGLQFPNTCTVDKGASGSYSYGAATTYTSTEISAWIADTNDRLASFVTMTGVVKKNGGNIDLIVGGGATANVTLYAPIATLISGLAEGDNITVTGYAISVLSSKCAIVPTEVVNNETTPKLLYEDITNVPAAGVTNAELTVTPYRIDGWTPAVTKTGCVSAASINAECTTVTYSVSNNESSSAQSGTIVVTFQKGGESDVVYTINVAQLGKTATLTGTINFGSASGSTNINADSVNGNDSIGNTWTITTEGTTSFTPNAAYAQVGSSKKPATSITLTTTLPASKKIKSISTKMGGFSGTTGTVTLKVGSTTVGTGSLSASSDVTVESSSESTGTVLTVTVTGIDKGVKVYYVSYEYYNE